MDDPVWAASCASAAAIRSDCAAIARASIEAATGPVAASSGKTIKPAPACRRALASIVARFASMSPDWGENCAATISLIRPAGNGDRSYRRSEEHTSELQSRRDLVCRLLLEKKKFTFYNLSPF